MTQHALIVGGTTGMGKSTAELLLKNGVEVSIIGRPNGQKDTAIAELSALGKVNGISIDLRNFKEVEAFVASFKTRFAQLDYLVNAAGYFKPKPFLEHEEADYNVYHDFNKAFFFITQAAAQVMAKGGSGSIVNIGSMWAKQAIKATPSSAYSMAKAGLHSLTQHLAMELAEYNIRVNAVSPAVVVTPIYGSFMEPEKIEENLQGFNDFHPIGTVGRPEQVADTIYHLLTASPWTTGAVWDIDGGVMAGRN